MKYPVNLKEGDGDPLFGLKNKQGSAQAFKRSWLDPSLWKVHPFTTKWMSLRSEEREAALAKFVSLMVNTKFFVASPDDDKFDQDGVLKTSLLDEAEREEFLEFLKEAQNAALQLSICLRCQVCAMEVTRENQIQTRFQLRRSG
jgi:hypothetical protein